VLFPINDVAEAGRNCSFCQECHDDAADAQGLAYQEFPAEVLKREATGPRWNVTAGVLRDIAAVADSSGTPTMFVLVPAVYQVEPKQFHQWAAGFNLKPEDFDLDQSNRIMFQELNAQGLTVIDATPSLRQAAK
jgi:hypothetical protein